MRSHPSVFLFVSVFMFTGCSVRIGTPSSRTYCPPAPECSDKAESNLGSRIAAARSISSFTERDSVLSVIAIDAAHECDIYNAVRALSGISSFAKRDSSAEKCADIFLEKQRTNEARKVADQVSSFTTRDRILSKIARTPAMTPSE